MAETSALPGDPAQRPRAIVISTGKRGHDIKGIGVAEHLGLEPEVRTVRLSPPWSWIAPRGRPPLPPGLQGPPWPDLVFASGRRTIPLARALKRQLGSSVFVTIFDDPGPSPDEFDLVWTSLHDDVAGDTILRTLTAPHRLTAHGLATEGAALAARLGLDPGDAPILGVVLGGPSKVYRFGEARGHGLPRSLPACSARAGPAFSWPGRAAHRRT
ncbi:hypothetical protein A6302_03267 [Methylobrevis pamukkalensis]|uniref:Uncharacterized protein n=1 Tax=Methylobrevis pamukkalensis TaxID=1439726 RepID=A0A1E3GZB9_9HYPH|nr:ELM1/GtrOC1 family putative glycosyltransferase [Methylobrevis pamukkalensis]ODN69429.1 hypothetical protein A6302_03267 [Methylobrevis pamukkalensis]